MQKGQLYSIDFVISAGLFVLATGIILGIYENASYSEKETMARNELTAIALNAANMLLESNPCTLEGTATTGFMAQGYRILGCSTAGTSTPITKSALMIPEGFKCTASINNSAMTGINECNKTPDAQTQDVASIERTYLSKTGGGAMTKLEYEKCMAGGTCAYTENNLTLKVWK